MASKKRRKKASKKTSKKVSKKVGRKRTKHRKIAVVHSPNTELSLLHNIDRKVERIDRTVNAGFHLARKAKHAKRRSDLRNAFEEAEREGITAE